MPLHRFFIAYFFIAYFAPLMGTFKKNNLTPGLTGPLSSSNFVKTTSDLRKGESKVVLRAMHLQSFKKQL
jgi:hypothetical protein